MEDSVAFLFCRYVKQKLGEMSVVACYVGGIGYFHVVASRLLGVDICGFESCTCCTENVVAHVVSYVHTFVSAKREAVKCYVKYLFLGLFYAHLGGDDHSVKKWQKLKQLKLGKGKARLRV